jgi:hypothetical protein
VILGVPGRFVTNIHGMPCGEQSKIYAQPFLVLDVYIVLILA